jgi:hypothetical protein
MMQYMLTDEGSPTPNMLGPHHLLSRIGRSVQSSSRHSLWRRRALQLKKLTATQQHRPLRHASKISGRASPTKSFATYQITALNVKHHIVSKRDGRDEVDAQTDVHGTTRLNDVNAQRLPHMHPAMQQGSQQLRHTPTTESSCNHDSNPQPTHTITHRRAQFLPN